MKWIGVILLGVTLAFVALITSKVTGAAVKVAPLMAWGFFESFSFKFKAKELNNI